MKTSNKENTQAKTCGNHQRKRTHRAPIEFESESLRLIQHARRRMKAKAP